MGLLIRGFITFILVLACTAAIFLIDHEASTILLRGLLTMALLWLPCIVIISLMKKKSILQSWLEYWLFCSFIGIILLAMQGWLGPIAK